MLIDYEQTCISKSLVVYCESWMLEREWERERERERLGSQD